MVSVYRAVERGRPTGYVRQVCDSRGFLRSALVTAPYRTPDGIRQLRTMTIKKLGSVTFYRHGDYVQSAIDRAWRNSTQRRKLLRGGDVR
jgi:hypothetical protein